MNRIEICPGCESEQKVIKEKVIKHIPVEDEIISIECELLKCLSCLEHFDCPEKPVDEVNLAFREYRNKHKMFQPEQLKKFREDLGLNIESIAKILGISGQELFSYEVGCLQNIRVETQMKQLFLLYMALKIAKEKGDYFLRKGFREIFRGTRKLLHG